MKIKSQRLSVLQVNLHHSMAAAAVLCVAMRNCDVALIQEPWTYMGEINGLKEVGGERIYRSNQNPRTCILVKKYFQILPLKHYCSRHLTAVTIKTSCGREPREIILGSAYFPCDDFEPLPPGSWRGWWQDVDLTDLTLLSAEMRMTITQPGGVQILTTEVSPCLILLQLTIWT
jgi:hypothetical protein